MLCDIDGVPAYGADQSGSVNRAAYHGRSGARDIDEVSMIGIEMNVLYMLRALCADFLNAQPTLHYVGGTWWM